MEELIKTFHIDWKLMLAQLVNFVLVLWVIWRFALRPLGKVMDERSKTIDKSLADAKEIEANLAKIEKEREAKIQEAKKEAAQLIEHARTAGQTQGEQMVAEAKREVQTVIAVAKEQMVQEKKEMLKSVKAEVAGLVTLSLHKILGQASSQKIDEKLIGESLKDIKH